MGKKKKGENKSDTILDLLLDNCRHTIGIFKHLLETNQITNESYNKNIYEMLRKIKDAVGEDAVKKLYEEAETGNSGETEVSEEIYDKYSIHKIPAHKTWTSTATSTQFVPTMQFYSVDGSGIPCNPSRNDTDATDKF